VRSGSMLSEIWSGALLLDVPTHRLSTKSSHRRSTNACSLNAMNEAKERLDRLTAGWHNYRRRQWTAGLAWLGFLPLSALVVFIVGTITQSDVLVTWIFASFAVLTFGAGWWFILFPCPNCGHHFHLTPSVRMTNGRCCPHCGLKRYQYE
jgi:hypothetical protein